MGDARKGAREAVAAVGRVKYIAFEEEREGAETLKCLEDYVERKLCREEGDSLYYFV